METDHRRNYVTVWSIVSRGTHWNVCVNHHLRHANKNDIRSAPKGENTHRHSRRTGWTGRSQTFSSIFTAVFRDSQIRRPGLLLNTHTSGPSNAHKRDSMQQKLKCMSLNGLSDCLRSALKESTLAGSLLEVLGAIRTPPGASVDVHSQLNYA